MKKEKAENIIVTNEEKKKQLLTFAIGVLVGAIITTGIFLVIRTNDRPKMRDFDPTTFEKGDFDTSKFPKRDKDSKIERRQDETKQNQSVESGE